jgi:hypothetical protein
MIFIVLGVYVSLAVWILQRQRIGRNLKIILGGAFTVVFAILVLFLQQEHFLGDVAWYDRAPYVRAYYSF